MNPPSQELSEKSKVRLTLWISLFKMQQQAGQIDFKCECLFHACSIAANLLTSPNKTIRIAVLLCCAALTKHGTASCFTHSFIAAALIQAVLQANTEPFKNALLNSNQIVEMSNRFGTLLVPLKIVSKWSAVSSHVLLNTKLGILLHYSYLIRWTLSIFSKYGKLFDMPVYTNIHCAGAGISTFMSSFWRPYIFLRKIEKTRPVMEGMDGKVFIPLQSQHSVFVVDMIKVLLPICTLAWRVNNYVSRQRKNIYMINESTVI